MQRRRSLSRGTRRFLRMEAISGTRALLLATCVVVTIAFGVQAHKPVAIDESFPSPAQALRIEELDVSQVAYVELAAEAPEFWMTFDIVEPIDLFVSLGVPVLDRLADYRPRLAVIREPSGEEIATFDTAATRTPERFYEPFTGTESWILMEETVSISEPGTYYIVASAPPESADKLWVAVGRRESFGLSDVLSLPAIVRRVRAFHEVPQRGATMLEWAALLGFAVLAAIVVVAAIQSAE